MQPWQGRRATVHTYLNVRLESKSHSTTSAHQVLTTPNSYKIPPWITDDAGSKMQKRVWDSLSKRLNAIQPGCI
jgi:hypothetical protein